MGRASPRRKAGMQSWSCSTSPGNLWFSLTFQFDRLSPRPEDHKPQRSIKSSKDSTWGSRPLISKWLYNQTAIQLQGSATGDGEATQDAGREDHQPVGQRNHFQTQLSNFLVVRPQAGYFASLSLKFLREWAWWKCLPHWVAMRMKWINAQKEFSETQGTQEVLLL